MGVILTSSGRNSNAPIKMMPVDMLGAVTIYYVAPLNNGFFMWFVLTLAPASHARPLHASLGPWLRLLGLPSSCGDSCPARSGSGAGGGGWPLQSLPMSQASAGSVDCPLPTRFSRLTVPPSDHWKGATHSASSCRFHFVSQGNFYIFFSVWCTHSLCGTLWTGLSHTWLTR